MQLNLKKLLLSSCFILCSSQLNAANAFKTGLEFRSDLEINGGKDPGLTTGNIRADANDEKESKRFNVSWARLVFSGDVNEQTSYLIKLNAKGNTLTSSDYGVSPAFSDAFAIYKLNDSFHMNFGKMYLLTSGFEGGPRPQDIYMYTLSRSYVPVTSTGVRFKLMHAGQTLMLSMTNGGEELNQKTPMFGALWSGTLLDDMLKTSFSYFHKSLAKQSGSPTGVTDKDRKTDKILALGLQGNFLEKKLIVELEYNHNTHEKNTNNQNDNETSVYTQVSYRHENFKPFVKLESSKQVKADARFLNRSAYSFGLEYFPVEDSNFRLHTVYWNREDTYKSDVAATATTGARSSGTKVESSQILLGLAFEV